MSNPTPDDKKIVPTLFVPSEWPAMIRIVKPETWRALSELPGEHAQLRLQVARQRS